MKTRIISAIVALCIFIPIFAIGGLTFKIAVYVIAMLGVREYLKVREKKKEFPNFIKLIAYLWLTIIFFELQVNESMIMIIDFRYLISLFLVLMFPIILYHDNKKYNINDACYIIAGTMFLSSSLSLGVMYRNMSLSLIVYLFLITSLTDSFALFTGRLVGKNKLLEVISPNKTWEGFIGGSAIATFVCSCFYITVVNPESSIYMTVFMTLFLSIIGQLGDLFFSAIKRYYDIKDFSNIMPGHGGILDRLDSIIFVMLTYSVFMTFI
ncbi:MAG: phosphatidate cytidylyltransferase [Bacilli bacterium]|nr:phosphatidate cytidylyltransferase [Bacilli bacterium]